MTPFEKLSQANKDYHEAVDEIFCDEGLIDDVEIRASIKAEFGVQINQVFHHMDIAAGIVTDYYPEE